MKKMIISGRKLILYMMIIFIALNLKYCYLKDKEREKWHQRVKM
jgi:hypothetical protein